MKQLLCSLLAFFCLLNVWGNDTITLSEREYSDSINASFKYEKGTITIGDNLATLKVPAGYKYLDPKQSAYVLHNLWGNPEASTLGMLIPEKYGPMDNQCWVIDMYYTEEGYIEDDDAKDLNYDDILEDMQEEAKDANPERVKEGYPTIELIGWAAPPFYDAEKHKLHWAKELKFGNDSISTLNYNIRILGRKGYLVLNAIGSIEILPEVKKDVDKVLASVDFNVGNKYADFDPKVDKVAAYGIGGLIAGKVLAKVGFFAFIGKFLKFIIAGLLGVFYFLKRKFFGSKNTELEPVAAPTPENSQEKE
jgi:uncharacterized membrane-anchored protein